MYTDRQTGQVSNIPVPLSAASRAFMMGKSRPRRTKPSEAADARQTPGGSSGPSPGRRALLLTREEYRGPRLLATGTLVPHMASTLLF